MSVVRIIIAVTSAAVLVSTGFVYSQYQALSQGMTTSNALSANAPKSTDGSTNILIMGLTTRNDLNGNPLPQNVLDALHAGPSGVGGYNTNTLILLHVPGNGAQATAFSIPRDDFVQYVDPTAVGQKYGKIKEAYGRAKAITEAALQKQGVTDPITLEAKGREAGRAATIANVRALTGVPIDHFVEVSLVGFYDLANALGGVTVCLNQATSDPYSGFVGVQGVQTLNGAQALAFVRQRHNLPNGDLDRTRRQQAFISSMTHKLASAGTFTNFTELQNLISVAQKDVVIDSGWNLLSFAQQASNLTGGNIVFHTLPILGYATINGQASNTIDPAAIKTAVQTAFGMKPSASNNTPPTSTVDVYNTSGVGGQASTLSNELSQIGYNVGTVGNGNNVISQSEIKYGTDALGDASVLAGKLGIGLVSASSAVPAGQVAIYIGDAPFSQGGGYQNPVPQPPAPSSTAPSSTPAPPAPSSPALGTTMNGGGIPCVN